MIRIPVRVMLASVLVIAFLAPGASADDDLVPVPDLYGKSRKYVEAALRDAGLQLGTIYEMAWQRVVDHFGVNIPMGHVVVQSPPHKRGGEVVRVKRGRKVRIILSAAQDGRLPKRLPPRRAKPPSDEPATQPKDEPKPDPKDEPRPEPKAEPKDEPVPEPGDQDPGSEVPDRGSGEQGAEDDDVTATGSPEAPMPAPKPNKDIVPPLMGLDLAVAEQLCRDAKMTLYVERVAGHPVGRVLEQKPEAYEPRGPGGVVRVIATAGGDYEAKMAPPPAVHVDQVDVPELLDRTEAQALRILRDLRLVGQPLAAKRGLPGRVANQRPLPGERVPVGSLVKVFIGPAAKTAPRTDAPQAPPSVAAPRPVSPAGGTAMPKTATVAAGFTWQAVEGATAYVLEIEEQAANGSWIQSVRKPIRKTAAMIELERLDTQNARPLRWRVRAVVNSTQGNPSAWVVLR